MLTYNPIIVYFEKVPLFYLEDCFMFKKRNRRVKFNKSFISRVQSM